MLLITEGKCIIIIECKTLLHCAVLYLPRTVNVFEPYCSDEKCYISEENVRQ